MCNEYINIHIVNQIFTVYTIKDGIPKITKHFDELFWPLPTVPRPPSMEEGGYVDKICYSVRKQDEKNGCWLGSPHAYK